MSAALAPTADIPPFLLFRTANERLRTDPTLTFRYVSEAQRKLARNIDRYEVLFRAGNSAGKTFVGAMLAVSMLRGKKELCGEALPYLSSPCVGWCVVQTYKGQIDGSQAAVLKCLGKWPHHAVSPVSGAPGAYTAIWVATDACTHGMDEHCDTCSRLIFHCSESSSNVGGRVDFVWADEPPKKKIWDECRQRGTADRLLVKYITATPKEKEWWWWMPVDFHGCEDNPIDGFLEIRSSMRDNKALKPEVLRQKLQAAAKDERTEAVINGDYVDLVGESPFPPDLLRRWLAKTQPPLRTELVTFTAIRQTRDGDAPIPVSAEVDIWHEYEDGEIYIGILDPATKLRLDHKTGLVARRWAREGSSSRGVPDPCGLHIYSRRNPRLVARFSGYSGAPGVGALAVVLARRYGNAILDTDLTGGYGAAAVSAITKAKYRRFNTFDPSTTAPGHSDDRLGFTMNSQNRAEMVGAIQDALVDDSLECLSEEAVRALMSITYVMTPSGKERPEADYGAKDEDMICMGRFLRLNQMIPLPAAKGISPEEKLGRLLGRRIMPMGRTRTTGIPRIRWNPR